jgi:cobalamin transport system substrate-binding protein
VRRNALAVALLVAGCGGAPPPRTAGPPARVVSLAPSATEIVYALGVGARLVGVCGQCDRPAEVARVPRVGGYLAPSVEATLAARPDLVIAVPSPGNREAVRAIERAGVRVLVVRDRTLDDLWASISGLADALGVPAEGARLATDLRQRLDGLRARLAGVAPRRVLVVVDHNPLVVVGGGTLQDELITIAGGTNVVRDVGSAWPTITLELVVARAPEVIIDAGMGNEGAAGEMFAGLTTVPAVRDGRIVRLRDDAFFRAGPRVADAAAALADAIHPGALAPDGASREAPPG